MLFLHNFLCSVKFGPFSWILSLQILSFPIQIYGTQKEFICLFYFHASSSIVKEHARYSTPTCVTSKVHCRYHVAGHFSGDRTLLCIHYFFSVLLKCEKSNISALLELCYICTSRDFLTVYLGLTNWHQYTVLKVICKFESAMCQKPFEKTRRNLTRNVVEKLVGLLSK